MKLDIVATPPQVYSDVEADVPIAFSIQPEGVVTALSQLTSVDLKMMVDGNEKMLSVVMGDILLGNHADAVSFPGNLFTLLVPEASFDSISVGGGNDISSDVEYNLTIGIEDGSQGIELGANETLEAFGDSSVQCVEIGVDETAIPATSFSESSWKNAENGYSFDTSPITFKTNPAPLYINLSFGSGNGLGSSYNLKVVLDDRPLNGTLGDLRLKYRGGSWHQQRGFYFVTYYGRKTVSGRTVVDVTVAGPSSYNVSAWGGADAKFVASVDSTYNEDKDITGFTLSVLSLPFSAVGGGKVGFAVSLAGTIWSGLGLVSVDDDATVYSDNFLLRNNKEGTPVTEADRDTIASGDGWGPAGKHSNKTFSVMPGDLGLLDFTASTEALHTVYGYNSSSVTCTDWSLYLNLGATHTEATLDFDPGDEKIRVTWNP
jgi:hypothetical protein